ncbi:hypothetical protein QDX25_06285 [Auritidibacter ignavus]|uniref:hypothetical protein n=2 Tax=Micrococcaceae TaxID=1268 RepID=UPI000D73D4E1|nr:hypothetical protein [Auritidibacter ignavus]PXA80172.1 hypothetical protein DCC25_07120 [Auritidibacter sp. NML120636]WGH80448.1 hypothetical protein QDX25_06285 [Auritidibacter ignavus]
MIWLMNSTQTIEAPWGVWVAVALIAGVLAVLVVMVAAVLRGSSNYRRSNTLKDFRARQRANDTTQCHEPRESTEPSESSTDTSEN